MDVEILPAGPFQTNSYLIINTKTKEAVAVDAGPESWSVLSGEAEKRNLKIKALLITHHHWDHMLDVHKFVAAGIPVMAHEDAVRQIENPSLQAHMAIPGIEFIPGKVDRLLKQGEELEVAGMALAVREAPGHCPGSLLFYFPDGGFCITGDVIFDRSIGRTDLPGGDMSLLSESILNQVYTLPEETILYPGHGSSTLVGKEKISNPFVRV